MNEEVFKKLSDFFNEIIESAGLNGIYEKDLIAKYLNFVAENEEILQMNIISAKRLGSYLKGFCFSKGISIVKTEKHLPSDLIDKCPLVKFKAYYFY